MKKYLSLLIILIVLISLFSCKKEPKYFEYYYPGDFENSIYLSTNKNDYQISEVITFYLSFGYYNSYSYFDVNYELVVFASNDNEYYELINLVGDNYYTPNNKVLVDKRQKDSYNLLDISRVQYNNNYIFDFEIPNISNDLVIEYKLTLYDKNVRLFNFCTKTIKLSQEGVTISDNYFIYSNLASIYVLNQFKETTPQFDKWDYWHQYY
jgi:hypothetical protein